MHYLLTEAEYNKLNQGIEKERERLKDTVNRLCQGLADFMPVEDWRHDSPSPWQCIKSVSIEWYCDGCPVKTACMEPSKHWSK